MSGPAPDELLALLSTTPALRNAYLVGGCVRDWLLGISNKDFDIEVFGAGYDELVEALSPHGRTDLVGRSFGVVKLRVKSGLQLDFSIPRRDSKTAAGHKGFTPEFDPRITPKQAAARRDFTINSLMFDPRKNRLLDFFGGENDLRLRILRHTSGAFAEDPLRVLRGMQFVARFGLAAAPETVDVCRQMKKLHAELALERIRDEWFKWAEKSAFPSGGLKFLAATEWLENYPELRALASTPQDSEWHPEGDVFVHTCHCCDALVNLTGWRESEPESRIVLSLATLAHDLGKPLTTCATRKEGEEHIVSPGHDVAGEAVTKKFLERIHAPKAIVDRVSPLVRHHLAHLQTLSDRSVRRLARRLEPENIRNLCLLMTADHFGRPPKPRTVPRSIRELEEKAEELRIQANAPKPILRGRNLIALGMEPGPQVGLLLNAAYESQLDGRIISLEDAYRWLAECRPAGLPDQIIVRLHNELGRTGTQTREPE